MKNGAEVFYYVDDAGKRNGPLSQEKLLSLYLAEKVSRLTLVWSAGMPEWVTLGEKFSEIIPPPVPVVCSKMIPLDPEAVAEGTNKVNNANYFLTFKGRAGRSEYWLLVIVSTILYFIAYGIAIYWWASVYSPDHPGVYGYMLGAVRDGGVIIAYTIVTLIIAWPSWVIAVKRWHDINKSGWWALLVLIPFIGWIVVVIANGFVPGTDGPNRFGEKLVG